jgi:hypothetical protein
MFALKALSAALLLVPAGAWNWWQAWVVIALLAALSVWAVCRVGWSMSASSPPYSGDSPRRTAFWSWRC